MATAQQRNTDEQDTRSMVDYDPRVDQETLRANVSTELPTTAQLDRVDCTAVDRRAGKMEDDAEDLRHGEEAALVSDAAAARRPWCQGLGAWFAEKFVGLAEGLGRHLKQALRGRAGEVEDPEELVAIPAGVGVTEQALRVCCLSTNSVRVLRTSHVAMFVCTL